jgi:hypothetical protein
LAVSRWDQPVGNAINLSMYVLYVGMRAEYSIFNNQKPSDLVLLAKLDDAEVQRTDRGEVETGLDCGKQELVWPNQLNPRQWQWDAALIDLGG